MAILRKATFGRFIYQKILYPNFPIGFRIRMMQKYLFLALAAATFALSGCSQDAEKSDNIGERASDTVATAETAKAENPTGARLYLQCRACHTLEASGVNGIGPNLHGVVGAEAGAKPGYRYSPALAQSGIVWTPEMLDAFLAKPNAVVPGTKMAFAGVASAEARRDLIAYLQEDQAK